MPAKFNPVLLQIRAKGLRILRRENIWNQMFPARCHAQKDCDMPQIPIGSVMNCLITERDWSDNPFRFAIFPS
jgi:hypothetical protein